MNVILVENDVNIKVEHQADIIRVFVAFAIYLNKLMIFNICVSDCLIMLNSYFLNQNLLKRLKYEIISKEENINNNRL